MIALQLLYVSLTVRDITKASDFYKDALGFRPTPIHSTTPHLPAELFGAKTMQRMLLERGKQFIELVTFDPPGALYPVDSQSNDLWFQHCALATRDIMKDYNILRMHNIVPISRHGPQLLPGGIIAFKFRDPDGHPLELIQFPTVSSLTDGGIDHSAVSVSNTERSIDFYTKTLGLKMRARQENSGQAQDELDNLDNTQVDVIALCPEQPSPHVELLCYKTPIGREASQKSPRDLAASRLVFKAHQSSSALKTEKLDEKTNLASIKDPDGHDIHILIDNVS